MRRFSGENGRSRLVSCHSHCLGKNIFSTHFPFSQTKEKQKQGTFLDFRYHLNEREGFRGTAMIFFHYLIIYRFVNLPVEVGFSGSVADLPVFNLKNAESYFERRKTLHVLLFVTGLC